MIALRVLLSKMAKQHLNGLQYWHFFALAGKMEARFGQPLSSQGPERHWEKRLWAL
jgi:hypothetical protein